MMMHECRLLCHRIGAMFLGGLPNSTGQRASSCLLSSFLPGRILDLVNCVNHQLGFVRLDVMARF